MKRLIRNTILIGAGFALIVGVILANTIHVNASVAKRTHVASAQTDTNALVNGLLQPAKWNPTDSYWRLAAPGTYTPIQVYCGDSACDYYIVEDNNTGEYMQWTSGTTGGTIHETTDSTLERAHWDLSLCSNSSDDYYEYANVYAESLGDNPWLQSNGIGVGLTLGDNGCSENASIWAIYNEN